MRDFRFLKDHKINGLNDALDIAVLDRPGHGGASHQYEIRLAPETPAQKPSHCLQQTLISFQRGPVPTSGVNGISIEALMAIVIDRLRGFQGFPVDPEVPASAQFSCYENAQALSHFEAGLAWLQKRTKDRVARDVEGKMAP